MAHHHGMRKKTRDKLSKTVRNRGISPVSRAIQEFDEGSKVHIIIDPSRHKGMPHPKFHGKTGEVIGKRGRAFILRVADGNATKTIIVKPDHLRAQYWPEWEVANFMSLFKQAMSNVKSKDKEQFFKKILKTIANNTESENYKQG